MKTIKTLAVAEAHASAILGHDVLLTLGVCPNRCSSDAHLAPQAYGYLLDWWECKAKSQLQCPHCGTPLRRVSRHNWDGQVITYVRRWGILRPATKEWWTGNKRWSKRKAKARRYKTEATAELSIEKIRDGRRVRLKVVEI